MSEKADESRLTERCCSRVRSQTTAETIEVLVFLFGLPYLLCFLILAKPNGSENSEREEAVNLTQVLFLSLPPFFSRSLSPFSDP
jgi:hypothetical protein